MFSLKMSVGPIPDHSSMQITHAIKNSSYAGYPLMQGSTPKQNVLRCSSHTESLKYSSETHTFYKKGRPATPVPNPRI